MVTGAAAGSAGRAPPCWVSRAGVAAPPFAAVFFDAAAPDAEASAAAPDAIDRRTIPCGAGAKESVCAIRAPTGRIGLSVRWVCRASGRSTTGPDHTAAGAAAGTAELSSGPATGVAVAPVAAAARESSGAPADVCGAASLRTTVGVATRPARAAASGALPGPGSMAEDRGNTEAAWA